MTIQSLQKIIQLETELCRNEQLEQEKNSAWIEKQQVEIARYYEKQLADFELKRKEFNEEIRADAEAKANEIKTSATNKAKYLEKLENAFLKKSLQKILPLIIGQDP